jgi:uncharacterized C2H2 Zn-finger protein
MPKIKAYKGNGLIIPVDEAKVATAFKCPWTDKVFGTKPAYIKHLKNVRKNIIHSNIRKKILDNLFNDLINQDSFEKIIEWIENHPEFVFDKAADYRKSPRLRDKFWIKITYLDLQWNTCVSNSHSCPRGGVTCWSSHEAKDGRPRGYPGWQGRIEFQLSGDIGFGSDVMRPLGIHTGTGGGINENRYGYDVKFFASDWPGLEKLVMLATLKGEWIPNAFRYGEPRYFRY